MDADMVIDNELQPGEADPIVWETRYGKCVVGIADIHQNVGLWPLIVGDLMLIHREIYFAVIDVAPVAFST